jgi:hypothetical protein
MRRVRAARRMLAQDDRLGRDPGEENAVENAFVVTLKLSASVARKAITSTADAFKNGFQQRSVP